MRGLFAIGIARAVLPPARASFSRQTKGNPMSFNFSAWFTEAEDFLAKASAVAAEVPAEVATATNVAASALAAAKAAASSLEAALNQLKQVAAPKSPAAS